MRKKYQRRIALEGGLSHLGFRLPEGRHEKTIMTNEPQKKVGL
jgi:hypothetical protein